VSLSQDNMGQVVDDGTIQNAKAAMDFGVETVCFTFLIWNTHVEFPKRLVNVLLAPKLLKPVRDQLKAAKVNVTAQMEKVLTLWESGYIVDEVAKKAVLLDSSALLRSSASASPQHHRS
jgi:hypothetical protein